MPDQEEEKTPALQQASFKPIHLENLPFPVLYKIFQNLPPKDQIALYLSSRIMWEISAKQIVFNSNKQIEKFLISYEVLTQEKLDEIYTSSSFSVLIEQIVKDDEEMPLQNGPRLHKNFLAVKSLKLGRFIIKKELLEILIGVFPNLESLIFTGDEFDRSVETATLPLAKLKNLKELHLTGSLPEAGSYFKDISCIPTSVQNLQLTRLLKVENIVHLSLLSKLKELALYHVTSTVLPLPLGLEKLTLVYGSSITDFSIILKLVQLEELLLLSSKIHDLSLLPIKKLKKLSLELCDKIKDASHLAKAEKLEWLKLGWISITHLPSLPSGLKYLELESCRGITNFEFLKNLEALEILKLHNMEIVDITILPKHVKELSLFGCNNIKDFTHLANLKELIKLDLSYANITDLSVLPNSLIELDLSGCKNIKFCPAWLKEGIKNNAIKVIDYDIEKLLAMPTTSPELLELEQRPGSTLVEWPEVISASTSEQKL